MAAVEDLEDGWAVVGRGRRREKAAKAAKAEEDKGETRAGGRRRDLEEQMGQQMGATAQRQRPLDATTPGSTTKDSTTKGSTTRDATTKDSTTKDSTTKDSTTKDSTTKDSTTRTGSTTRQGSMGEDVRPGPLQEEQDEQKEEPQQSQPRVQTSQQASATVVGSAERRRRRRPARAGGADDRSQPSEVVDGIVRRFAALPELTAYWSRVEAAMVDAVAAVVWLGLGSPTTSRAAQVQLALGLALHRHLGSARAVALEAFDPFFTPADGALLAALGVRVQLVNRSGAYVAAVPTVFIMPHCVRTLYDNVVRANLANLDRVCVFGNDLGRMGEDQPQAFPYLALMGELALRIDPPMKALEAAGPHETRQALFLQTAHVLPRSAMPVVRDRAADATQWARPRPATEADLVLADLVVDPNAALDAAGYVHSVV